MANVGHAAILGATRLVVKVHGRECALPRDAAAEHHARMNVAAIPDSAWALLFARLVLGLIFGMAGWGKLFDLGPVGHAHRYFVDPYASSWIPAWLLWGLGLAIPFVEFGAGWLLVVGFLVRPALIALGFILALVTYGHLLHDFLYEFHTHVIPRLALVLFLLVMPRAQDVLSLDHLLRRN
jgi:uncharacterized membrane protein YphA (DoxX/SURF4 family)